MSRKKRDEESEESEERRENKNNKKGRFCSHSTGYLCQTKQNEAEGRLNRSGRKRNKKTKIVKSSDGNCLLFPPLEGRKLFPPKLPASAKAVAHLAAYSLLEPGRRLRKKLFIRLHLLLLRASGNSIMWPVTCPGDSVVSDAGRDWLRSTPPSSA
jgi:hypothetical protein